MILTLTKQTMPFKTESQNWFSIFFLNVGLSEKSWSIFLCFLMAFVYMKNEDQSKMYCLFCSITFCCLAVIIILCSKKDLSLSAKNWTSLIQPHLNWMLYHTRSFEESKTSGSLTHEVRRVWWVWQHKHPSSRNFCRGIKPLVSSCHDGTRLLDD